MEETKSERILVETGNFNDLNVPLTRTSRLRYTSLSVSDKVLVLGSNTGGIYIFSKAECKLLQVAFAEKETAAVTQLLISPNEKFVAFTVSTGKVHVIDLKLDTRTKSETLRSVPDLGGAIVTCLKWDATSSKLFIGDDMGKVSMVSIHTSKAKNLFSIPMEVILKLDSAVVQIDKADDRLLVSTLSRCYLCYTSKQQYSQIGKKPRDGQYGACFLSQGSVTSMIYCARPGSRIWEVDMDGFVLNTHQFKQLLAVAPLSVVDINRKFTVPDEKTVYKGQSVAFPKLKIISETFLLTWNTTHIYILDPVNVRLILWTNHFNGITDICCLDNEIYVFLQTMQVHCLTLMPVPKAIQVCMTETKMETVARLCCFYGNILHRKHLRKHLGITDLYKIYNALVESELVELSTNVLSCIKDIETKVAMESETDTSDSTRSRSSSVHSAGSEHLTLSTDTKQSASGGRENKTVNREGKTENCVQIPDTKPSSSGVRDNKDMNLNDLTDNCDVRREGIEENLEIDFVESGISDVNSKGVSLQSMHNETLDELDGAMFVSGNQTVENCDINTVNNVKETDADMHGIDNNVIGMVNNSDSNKEAVCNAEKEVGSLNSAIKVTENIQVENSLCKADIERGEPDGNSYRDVYDENQVDFNKTGNQPSKDRENRVSDKFGVLASSGEPAVKCNTDSENEVCHRINPFTNELSFPPINEFGSAQSSSNGNGEPTEVQDVASLRIQTPWKSPNTSPVAIKEDHADIFEDDDTFLVNKIKSFGQRRQSLTSLSSFSSAEVTLDQPYTVGLSPEPGEQIATQVKRRALKKKKKRKSTTDIIGVNSEMTVSPTSLGSFNSITEGIPPIPVEVVVEPDTLNIPTFSDANMAADHIDGSVKETIREEHQQVVIITETTADDLNGSGEFQQSSEWGVSGEFSASETTLLQSWEASKDDLLSVSPSSAPKTAFSKFKTKMQSQVTTKTKKLIQNIKDKNLLSKAKEMAVETFSQNSDVSMVAGGYFDPDQFENFDQSGTGESGTKVNQRADGTIEETGFGIPTPLVDITDLEENTDKVKAQLDDAQTLTDIDTMYKLLSEWITILNKTFHKFHVRKFAPALNESEISTNDGYMSRNSNSYEQNETKERPDEEPHDTPNTNVDNEETSSQVSQPATYLDRVCDSDLEMASNNFEKILSDPDFCYLSDPIQLPVHLSRSVSTLVHACFDIGCHGDIMTYQKLYPGTKLCCDTNDESSEHTLQVVTYISKGADNKKGDNDVTAELKADMSDSQTTKPDTKVQVKLPDNVEKEQVEGDSGAIEIINGETIDLNIAIKDNSSIDKDREMDIDTGAGDQLDILEGDTADTHCDSRPDPECDNVTNTPMNFFIRLYYPYLHGHKIVKENLLYPEWSALVTCLQGCAMDDGERLGVKDDSIISHVLESRHQKNGSLTLLGHISRLFFTGDPNLVESSIRCFPHIQPIDMLNLCRFHNISMATVFKQYMLKMLEHLRTIHKPDLEECLFSHHDVRHKWLDLLLMEDSILDKVKDSNGYPRPMCHKLSRTNNDLIEQVLSKLSIYQPSDMRDMLSLFYTHGYWTGALQVLKHLKHTEEHCQVILYLRDIELLSHSHQLGYMPGTMKEWELLLSSFKELTDAGNQDPDLQSPDWPSTVTWNSLAILLVKNVGPDSALSLLEKCGIEEVELNAEFYQTCLLSGIVQKHKRSILHTMLEKVDTYLWSQRPAVVTPQVHYLLVNEGRLKSGSKLGGSGQEEETVQSLTTLLKGDKSDQQAPYAEDPECHWGVKTKFNMYCGCCSISLKEIVSHSESGVLLFRCGHGFHKQCLPERECILCDDDIPE